MGPPGGLSAQVPAWPWVGQAPSRQPSFCSSWGRKFPCSPGKLVCKQENREPDSKSHLRGPQSSRAGHTASCLWAAEAGPGKTSAGWRAGKGWAGGLGRLAAVGGVQEHLDPSPRRCSGTPWGGALREGPSGPPFVCCHGLGSTPPPCPLAAAPFQNTLYLATDMPSWNSGSKHSHMSYTFFKQRLESLKCAEDKHTLS